MSVASTSYPSQFATLLRRSKFASFDPQIGQVYATHGGYAHRGDYGLKRPLALRRRDGRITVKNIDSRHQQTEWRSAYLDSKFMLKQQEATTQVSLLYAKDSPRSWSRHLGDVTGSTGPWHTYSEYAMGPSKEGEEAADARRMKERKLLVDTEGMQVMPHLHSMTESHFNSYVKKAHNLVSAHRKFTKKNGSNPIDTLKEPSDRARRVASGDYVSFLTSEQSRRSSKHSSSFIRPLPHANAGLDYTHAPSAQHYFTSKPLPGRVIYATTGDRFDRTNSQAVTMAGWIGREFRRAEKNAPIATDFGPVEGGPRTNKEAGKAMFRTMDERLVQPPTVVDQVPQSMQDARIERVVATHFDWEETKIRKNPHPPGSREYVAHVEDQSATPAVANSGSSKMSNPTRKYVPKSKDADKVIPTGAILSNLTNMLGRMKSADEL